MPVFAKLPLRLTWLGGGSFPSQCVPKRELGNEGIQPHRVLTGPPQPTIFRTMKSFTAVIERCPETGLYVGYVPGFAGAHSQGETLDELRGNLSEVIAMLLEDGDPQLDAEFVGTQSITLAA